MHTEETKTAQKPTATALSKFKDQTLSKAEQQKIKGGDEELPPETEIIIHENVVDL